MIKRNKRLIFFLAIASVCGEAICKALPVSSDNSSINFPYQEAYINATRPTITGSLFDENYNPVSNETVEIFLNDLLIGTTTSNNDGIYALQVEQDLPDDQYNVTVFCLESQTLLGPNTFTIDTTLPSVVIVYPGEHEIIQSSTFTMSGVTEANAMVETFLDDDAYGLACYADDAGNWSIDYAADSGLHSIKAQSTDRAGNQGPLSAIRSFTITVLS